MMEKKLDYETVEKKWYAQWEENNVFAPSVNEDGSLKKGCDKSPSEVFSFVIPPPNVTGRLHMGHALNNTIQDLIARYYRMQGRDVLWVPGTDHAGIATQSVVKKKLDKEGVDYRELGREKFVKKVFEWKEKYGNYILSQIKSLGASCDWSRKRFTMDEKISVAVRHSFCKLYEQGLIYQGTRIVNWCPVDRTALSDDEVETAEGGEPGFLYSIAYKLVNSEDELVVSTTRPETLFGDVAVAVHPSDERYKKYVGQQVHLPLTNRTLPVLTDELVEMDFGSAVLKVTPAHDKTDFDIGRRHGLTPLNVMHEDARLNHHAGPDFEGLSREAARKKVLDVLEQQGLMRATEPRNIPLGRSYRSKAVIEYRLSRQWFVKMKPLAKGVLQKMDELHFHPPQFKKIFCYWLENIEDWCISRQIWWGHRIPVWKNIETGEIVAAENTPEVAKQNPSLWQQETDVLDTWYSSALFPFSVFGWPEKTSDFARYFPTELLSTAKDIIFFWVARMCMFSLHFEKKLPFTHVLIHPTITDYHGKTMSKSKGNGIDPQVVISGAELETLKMPIMEASPSNAATMLKEIEQRFPNGFEGVGCDALRYTLLHLLSSSQLVRLQMSDFNEIGRRFATKLWNASLFATSKVEAFLAENEDDISWFSADEMGDLFANCFEVTHIISALQKAKQNLVDDIENYNIATVSNTIYQLTWNDFCDWHIEITKARLQQLQMGKIVKGGNNSTKAQLLETAFLLASLLHIMKSLVILLHPALPFITEEINHHLQSLMQKLGLPINNAMLVESNYEIADFSFKVGESYLQHSAISGMSAAKLQAAAEKMELLKFVVSSVRSPRKRYNISFKLSLIVYIEQEAKNILDDRCANLIEKMGGVKLLFVSKDNFKKRATSKTAMVSTHNGMSLVVELGEHLDIEKEIERLQRIKKKLLTQLIPLTGRLQSAGFLKKASTQVIIATKNEQADITAQLAQIKSDLKDLL